MAPRQRSRFWQRCVRGAFVTWGIVAAGLVWPGPGAADHRVACVPGDGRHIETVCYSDVHGAPVYGHAVLGDTPEWDALRIVWGPDRKQAAQVIRAADHVFEDIAPRVVDLDGDEIPEIVAVQSSFTRGARLVVYRIGARLEQVATPYIGTRNRWLAPVGAVDLDGDGFVEIAYVDRPHLARTLRVWRYRSGRLEPVAEMTGLSNHRIGENFITGGIRDCGAGPEMILADGTWRDLVAVRLVSGRLERRVLRRFSAKEVARALACR